MEKKWLEAVAAASGLDALETVRVEALGKKGEISGLMKGLGALTPDERKSAGAKLNQLKDAVAAAIEARKSQLAEAAMDARLQGEKLDMTLPASLGAQGRLHPISQTIDEIIAIFGEMGFKVAEGPDIEEDFYNFTALNIPPDHPARQMHDTFYLGRADVAANTNHAGGTGVGGAAGDAGIQEKKFGKEATPTDLEGRRLLRTHTSPVQIRYMKSHQPPMRIIAPGRTYRCDSDMTHTPMFHQVEGLVVDEKTHMGHLKGCLTEFCRAFFGVADLPLRFRPSFFPFTEPSAEVDIGCSRKGGELKLGNYGDWLEILGCGMVHPKVLEMGGIDPARYQGFAFGMGIERIAMLKYGIPDLRTFFEADARWLAHYGFQPLDVPNLVGAPR
ncbi:MAG TPA: phenylalanine--tRNA ligase subunit alpha [Hypericibacter adhaerens]|uniref:phenylalanine--tRNA ligase subunit alpha n=1 Tax=Hypericibacter adhaerens TaxID=2602016 RepID=UPI002C988152|nr:phenylalanine--tRNA ligase subunit alpha [Hypericibacter adhaerens]HWA46616.1 phenylalanine--tRNA ligase subunit alpha [Hypericibacter adhaerens]